MRAPPQTKSQMRGARKSVAIDQNYAQSGRARGRLLVMGPIVSHRAIQPLLHACALRARAERMAAACADSSGAAAAEACLDRGDASLERHDYVAALREYSRSAELDPQSSEAWMSRALALEELGRWAEAAASYLRAVELEPDDPDFRRLHQTAAATAAGHAAAMATPGISTLTSAGCCRNVTPDLAHQTAAEGLRDDRYAIVDGFCDDAAELVGWLQGCKAAGELRRGEVSSDAQAASRNDMTLALSPNQLSNDHPPALGCFIDALDEAVCALQQSQQLGALLPATGLAASGGVASDLLQSWCWRVRSACGRPVWQRWAHADGNLVPK